jgi:hypothetical protein
LDSVDWQLQPLNTTIHKRLPWVLSQPRDVQPELPPLNTTFREPVPWALSQPLDVQSDLQPLDTIIQKHDVWALSQPFAVMPGLPPLNTTIYKRLPWSLIQPLDVMPQLQPQNTMWSTFQEPVPWALSRTLGVPAKLQPTNTTTKKPLPGAFIQPLEVLLELQPLDTTFQKPVLWAYSKPIVATTFKELAGAAAVSSLPPCSMAGPAIMPFTTSRGRPLNTDGGYLSASNSTQLAGVNNSLLTHNPDTKQVCIKVSALTAVPYKPFALPGSCLQLRMTSLKQVPKALPPSGPIMTQKLPARVQLQLQKVPDTCEYGQETGDVLPLELPVLAPGMPDLYPDSADNASNSSPCEWQSWLLNAQVGR